MSNSVLEVVEQSLTGGLTVIMPGMSVTALDRVLGPLKSPIVPKLMAVVFHFGIDASKMNASPAVSVGVNAVINLIKSELINEYGAQISPDDEVAARWHDTQGWVVVAVSRKHLFGFTASPGVN